MADPDRAQASGSAGRAGWTAASWPPAGCRGSTRRQHRPAPTCWSAARPGRPRPRVRRRDARPRRGRGPRPRARAGWSREVDLALRRPARTAPARPSLAWARRARLRARRWSTCSAGSALPVAGRPAGRAGRRGGAPTTTGYTLRSFVGPVPDELVEGWAALSATPDDRGADGRHRARGRDRRRRRGSAPSEALLAEAGPASRSTPSPSRRTARVVAYTDLACHGARVGARLPVGHAGPPRPPRSPARARGQGRQPAAAPGDPAPDHHGGHLQRRRERADGRRSTSGSASVPVQRWLGESRSAR